MAGNKLKLSKNILEMKFMKKCKEKVERDAEREEATLLFNSEVSDTMINGGDQCIVEPSFVPCQQLKFGRFSFKGMNPEIEQLMQDNELKNKEKLRGMGGISAREMADRYSTLMDTVYYKFVPKRKRNFLDDNSNKKFKRPPSDS